MTTMKDPLNDLINISFVILRLKIVSNEIKTLQIPSYSKSNLIVSGTAEEGSFKADPVIIFADSNLGAIPQILIDINSEFVRK